MWMWSIFHGKIGLIEVLVPKGLQEKESIMSVRYW